MKTIGSLFLAAFFAAAPSAFALTPNQIMDRDIAFQIWGNPQNWTSSPHPNASYFAHPIADGMAARPMGMGEAFTAISDDISGVWYNPAGLTHMAHNEINWMSGDRDMQAYPDTGFFSATYMLENHMVFGLSFQRPYHPVGRYPDLIAGNYYFSNDHWTNGTPYNGWSADSWAVDPNTGTQVGPPQRSANPCTSCPNGSPVLVPGNPGSVVPFSNVIDTQAQDFLKNAYRYWINLPFQENDYVFTYATPLSPDRNLSMGINVKYLVQDSWSYMADGVAMDEVQGWGADLGFHYLLPLARPGRSVAFGLDIRDIASQIRGDNNREITLPSTATLGVAWRAADIWSDSKLNLAADFVYINDPAIEFAHNHRLNLGGEMTFFHDHMAPRLGYDLFFDQPSRATIGITFNYLVELDYAYHLPALNEDASHWFSVAVKWGGPKEEKPLPEVSVSAEPPIFSPRNGELATFTLSAEAKSGVDRWSLSIFDRNNQAVKTYQDRGNPPSQILWGGEDKTYRPLPDGEYTYIFSATDNLGTTNTTPLQTLHLYTTLPKTPEKGDLDALRGLIKSQETAEESQEDSLAKTLKVDLAGLTKRQMTNQTLPDLAKAPAPETAAPASGTAQSGAVVPTVPGFSYPNVNDVPVPRMGFVTEPGGQKSFQLEYDTLQSMPRTILADMLDQVKVTAHDIGEAAPRYDFRARYGNRVLRLVAPSSAAQSLAHGFISPNQFFRASSVTLDGDPINPTY
jgi:hypothetical protein